MAKSGVEDAGIDDAALVERSRDGDATAYDALVRRHQQVAFRAAYIITGSAPDAEDAAQEAFVKAYLALGRFRPGAPFRPWLLRIVANEARNRRRTAIRRPAFALRDDAAETVADPSLSPEEAALADDRRRRLLSAVNELREDDRAVIAYRYFLDLGEAETADALGCARGTVKSRLSRALARLRDRLGSDQDGAPHG